MSYVYIYRRNIDENKQKIKVSKNLPKIFDKGKIRCYSIICRQEINKSGKKENQKKMIKILDKLKSVWYYIRVSTLKMLDTEPEILKSISHK